MGFRDMTTLAASAPAAATASAPAPAAATDCAPAAAPTTGSAPSKKTMTLADRIKGKKPSDAAAVDAKTAAQNISTASLAKAAAALGKGKKPTPPAPPAPPAPAAAAAPKRGTAVAPSDDNSYDPELLEAIVEMAEHFLPAGFGFALTDEAKRAGVVGSHTGHVFIRTDKDVHDDGDKDWLRVRQGDPTDDEVSERVEAFSRACSALIDAAVADITETDEIEMPEYQPVKKALRVYALHKAFTVVHMNKDRELAPTKYSGIVIQLPEDYLNDYLVVAGPTEE